MYFDKDEAAKRQIQKAYYQGLKEQIQMKNSKITDKDKRHSYDYQSAQKQQFSLIKNIQTEEEIRKNKKSQYYSQLRRQLEDQKNKKQKMKQEQKRLEKLQEEKINRENQVLRQRYEQQIKKEKKGSNNNIKEDNSNTNINTVNNNQNQTNKNTRKMTNHLNPIQHSEQNKKHFSNKNEDFKRLKTSDSQQEDYQPQNSLQLQSLNYGDRSRQNSSIQLNHMPTYANRIQNQPFNYIPKKRHMDSYFKQLLVHRREFQHQASGISQLNKLFHQQRYRPQKIQSRGLEELKNLQSMLQQKSAQYMSNLNSRSSRSYQISQNSMFKSKQDSKFYQPKDQWRRLD